MSDQRDYLVRKALIFQFIAVALMIGSIAIGNRAVMQHDNVMVVNSAFLFSVNMALFVWQRYIRIKLKRKD